MGGPMCACASNAGTRNWRAHRRRWNSCLRRRVPNRKRRRRPRIRTVPELRQRRLLLLAGLVGLVFACAGLVQISAARNLADWNGGRWLLVVAWLILTPLFIYVMGLRQ